MSISDDKNILISKQKYVCVSSILLPTIYVGEIYTIYKYKNIVNKKLFYRIFNNKNEWRYSFEIDSTVDARLKESFISIKDLRKQKLDKLNSL